MPSSYSPTRGNPVDKAREQLGDTAVQPSTTLILDEDALHSDAHIAAVQGRYGEALGLSYLAHELWARFAQDPQRIGSQGDTIDLSSQLVVWSKLAQPWLDHQNKEAADAATATSRSGRGTRIGQITAGTDHQLR